MKYHITYQNSRFGFAGILVEVDINVEFPKNIEEDMGNGRSCVVEIEYPWIPLRCKQCKMFGHVAFACPNKINKVWIPTTKMKVNEKQNVPEKKSVEERVQFNFF